MDVKTEPAGRLIDILEEARAKPETSSVRVVWGEVFGVDAEETGTILKMLAELIQLVSHAKYQIQKLEGVDNELYLYPFRRVEKLLSTINLEASWKHNKGIIDDQTIFGLKFGSDRLNREIKISAIKEKDLELIKTSLTELSDLVQNSDLEIELKRLLVRNLESLRRAIVAYKINGIEGLETELEACVGAVVLNKDKVKRAADAPKGKTILEKYFSCLNFVNKTVSAAQNVEKLSESGLTKLLGGD